MEAIRKIEKTIHVHHALSGVESGVLYDAPTYDEVQAAWHGDKLVYLYVPDDLVIWRSERSKSPDNDRIDYVHIEEGVVPILGFKYELVKVDPPKDGEESFRFLVRPRRHYWWRRLARQDWRWIHVGRDSASSSPYSRLLTRFLV